VAARGTSKALSVEHEEFVGKYYGGRRSRSSGGADNDQGDVRQGTPWSGDHLIECKLTGRPGKPATATLLKTFEKIAEEAYSEGREPLIALRFFKPDSPLANSKGWVDLVVRSLESDVENLAAKAGGAVWR